MWALFWFPACSSDRASAPTAEAVATSTQQPSARSPDEVAPVEAARSVVQFGDMKLELKTPILQVYAEGADGSPPDIHLFYSAEYAPESFLDIVIPYEQGNLRASIPESRAFVSLGRAAQRLRSLNVVRLGERIRLELRGLEYAGATVDLDPALFASGSVEGELERFCQVFELDPAAPHLNGVPGAAASYRRGLVEQLLRSV